jgi:hypothetical protein
MNVARTAAHKCHNARCDLTGAAGNLREGDERHLAPIEHPATVNLGGVGDGIRVVTPFLVCVVLAVAWRRWTR